MSGERAVQCGAGFEDTACPAKRGDRLGQDVLVGYGLDGSSVVIRQRFELGACERHHGRRATRFRGLFEAFLEAFLEETFSPEQQDNARVRRRDFMAWKGYMSGCWLADTRPESGRTPGKLLVKWAGKNQPGAGSFGSRYAVSATHQAPEFNVGEGFP